MTSILNNIIRHNKTNYSNIAISSVFRVSMHYNLVSPFPINIIKRYYPGFFGFLKFGHAPKIFHFLNYKSSFASIIPFSSLHRVKIYKRVAFEHYTLGLTSNNPFYVNSSGTTTLTLPILLEPSTNIVVSSFNNQQKISGLLNIPPECYTTNNTSYAIEFKKLVLISYTKVVYTLLSHHVTSDEQLYKIFPELFKSIYPIFQNFNNKSFQTREMAILQHVLVSLFENKEFSLEFFKKLTGYTVDYIQFEKIKTGSMLNAIESHVYSQTGLSLGNKYSMVAVNPDYCLELTLYNKLKAKKTAKQENTDWFGTLAITDNVGNTIIDDIYNDSKMYESGAFRGHLTLKPGLAYNEQILREYLTKHTTGMQKILSDNNIIDENHYAFQFYKRIKDRQDEIFIKIRTFKRDKYKNFIDKTELLEIKKVLSEYQAILFNASAHLKNITNMGFAADPGIDSLFIEFFNEHMKILFNTENFLNKFYLQILLNSKFDKKLHLSQIKLLIDHLPQHLKNSTHPVILYIENQC